MKYQNAKRIASSMFAVVLAVSSTNPLIAEELNTEMPSAGATVVIEDYIANAGTESDLSSYLPKEATTIAASEGQAPSGGSTDNLANKQNEYFEDIAIAKVNGGNEDYVNVRKKPNTNSKVEGKIYNNCGARILEKTSNGWYKIVSGHCTGYIKAEYFVTGSQAKDQALDNGYVFANIKDTGIHVREKNTTESKVLTNVYHNDNYSIKKFSRDGKWVKLKIGPGVSGWVSSEYVKVSIDMDTAITIKEEKAIIKAEKERAAREAAEAAAAAERERQEQQAQQNQADSSYDAEDDDDDNGYSNTPNTQTYTNSTGGSSSDSSSTQNYGDSGGSGASSVVAYAKRFLGNPYVWGGSSLTNGTDCSGFTMSVYAHFGYSLNRSSYTQVYNGRSVSLGALEPGDLLFYKYGGSTISHVAIYIGGGQIIHASTEETGIIISGMGSPCAARRIIG